MDEPYIDDTKPPKISLPDGWPSVALDALLHVISLARLAMTNARNWPSDADELNLRAICDRLRTQLALTRRELAIKDARLARIPPSKRPEYSPNERLQILMLKAAIGLNNAQLARRFHVSVQTIRNWFRRLPAGDDLVAMPEKVTRYPDYLRYVVQQLKVICPLLGKRKMADFLARAGLHLSASTVGRIVKEPPIDPEAVDSSDEPLEPTPSREIIANYAPACMVRRLDGSPNPQRLLDALVAERAVPALAVLLACVDRDRSLLAAFTWLGRLWQAADHRTGHRRAGSHDRRARQQAEVYRG